MNTVFVMADLMNVVGDPIGLVMLYLFAMIAWGTMAKYDRRPRRRAMSTRPDRAERGW